MESDNARHDHNIDLSRVFLACRDWTGCRALDLHCLCKWTLVAGSIFLLAPLFNR